MKMARGRKISGILGVGDEFYCPVVGPHGSSELEGENAIQQKFSLGLKSYGKFPCSDASDADVFLR